MSRNDIEKSVFLVEEHTQFHLFVDDVSLTPESLCDISGQFIECHDEIKSAPTTDLEEELVDVDLVLFGDENSTILIIIMI